MKFGKDIRGLYTIELDRSEHRHLYKIPMSNSTTRSDELRAWCWRDGETSIVHSVSTLSHSVIFFFHRKQDLRLFVLTWL